jgi:hypothetical protein
LVFRRVPRTQVERTQGLGRPVPQRPDELAVVRVRDLAGAVVELELLQGGESTISLLGELEATLLELIRRGEPVFPRLRLAEERQGNEHHAHDSEGGTDHECRRHIRIAVLS